MPTNLNTLVAVATLGAGLVHLAVGAGSPLPLLAVFVAVGVAEIGWAVAVLRLERVPAARVFLGVLLLPLTVWTVVIGVGAGSSLPLGPLAAASLLTVAVAVVVVLTTVRSARTNVVPARAADEEHPWRFIGTLAASAAIVAGIVTPALSGTWAGQFAEPHGSHDVPGLDIEEHAGH
ncbi:hypothetical protein CLV49_0788 [Labedella gwakjiensis]|uniref:Uncharacterized protein n=1 Tax=Labedella gwakjiensis TaxID=390269 RepID=A0A2P8GT93_9MICO|nr:hypothetical protein [Labedella gwakjiensis]PSL37181.1 hypothetical protein CLV49_0788 [Labedella gwakjiensis]RUQ81922.1 hypothetical protein ELQ93_16660 [Labedella gwakjiensis]